MTAQEAFDTSVRGLASQNFEKSTAFRGTVSAYRGDHDRRCAIGWIISDEDIRGYNSEPVGRLPNRLLPPKCDLDFLSDLQMAHDHSFSGNSMKRRLREVAKAHGLSTAVLDEVAP